MQAGLTDSKGCVFLQYCSRTNTFSFADLTGFPWSVGFCLFVCWLFGFLCLKPALSDLPSIKSELATVGSLKPPRIISTWKFNYDGRLSIKPNCALLWGRKQGNADWDTRRADETSGHVLTGGIMGWAPERRCRMVLLGFLSEGTTVSLYSSGACSHADIALSIGYLLTLVVSQRAKDTRNLDITILTHWSLPGSQA